MPVLKATDKQQISIGVSAVSTSGFNPDEMSVYPSGGLWEDEEERRFYEDLIDLVDFIPRQALGISTADETEDGGVSMDEAKKSEEQDLLEELNREIEELEKNHVNGERNGRVDTKSADDDK
jgi:regulator of nonsense transcripts 2